MNDQENNPPELQNELPQQHPPPIANNGAAPNANNEAAPNVNQNQVAVAFRNLARRQRDMQMRRVERWIEFIQQAEFAQTNCHDIKNRIERGAQLLKQMEEVQAKVIDAAVPLGEDPIAAYGIEFMDLEDRYWHTVDVLTNRLAELAPAPEQQNAANAAGAAPQINVQMAPPPNTLNNTWGYFDGNLLQWREFKERYTAQVHLNNNIDAVYKFSYLKKSLNGTPAGLLKGYEVTPANYQAAWDVLLDKYDRKYPLAREYLRQFFSLKAVSTPATAKELQHLSSVTMETVRNLQGLEYPVEQWDMVIVHVLHGLLNNQLTYEWNMEINQNGDEPTTAQIVAFLDKHSAAAINTDQPRKQLVVDVQNDQANRNSGNANRGNSNANRNRSRTPSVASSQGATQGTAQGTAEKWKYPCGACDGNHKIYYCPEFTALNYKGRVALVTKKNLCVLCLKRGHAVSSCFDMNRCTQQQCRNANDTKHNSMLCKHQVDQQVARPAINEGQSNSHQSRAKQRRANDDRAQ